MPTPTNRTDIDALQRLREATSFNEPVEWDGTTRDDEGTYTPEGSTLGDTLIQLAGHYDSGSEDCEYLAAIVNAAPPMLAELAELRAMVGMATEYRVGKWYSPKLHERTLIVKPCEWTTGWAIFPANRTDAFGVAQGDFVNAFADMTVFPTATEALTVARGLCEGEGGGT